MSSFRALKNSARSMVFVLAVLATNAVLNAHQVHAQDAAGKVLFILDASGSMWGEVGGEDKIAIAKRVMTDLVRQLPAELETGLEIWLGTVTATNVKGSILYLLDPTTGAEVAGMAVDGLSVQVPAGSYKVKLSDVEMGTIDVVASQELIIE